MHVPILNHKLIGIKNVIDNNIKLNNNSFLVSELIIPNMIYISGNAIYNPFNISLPSFYIYINNIIIILEIVIFIILFIYFSLPFPSLVYHKKANLVIDLL